MLRVARLQLGAARRELMVLHAVSLGTRPQQCVYLSAQLAVAVPALGTAAPLDAPSRQVFIRHCLYKWLSLVSWPSCRTDLGRRLCAAACA